MKVNLHIDRLILDGMRFDATERANLQEAIETELAALLAQENIASNWPSGGAVPRLRAAEIQMTANNNPAQLGKQIAGSVYGSIGKVL